MIGKMRRARIMDDVINGGTNRTKWTGDVVNPTTARGEVEEAVDAMNATNDVIHQLLNHSGAAQTLTLPAPPAGPSSSEADQDTTPAEGEACRLFNPS